MCVSYVYAHNSHNNDREHRVPCSVTVLVILLKQVLSLTLQLSCSQQAPASFCVPPPDLWSYRHAQPSLVCSGVLGIGTQALMLVQLFLPTGLSLSLWSLRPSFLSSSLTSLTEWGMI